MSIDLAEFHEIYFAECLENIDQLQDGLTLLTPETLHGVTMTRAYRAAHSIKGASAIFGFQGVADSAQALEIMLDQIRRGKRELNSDLAELLRQSIGRLQKKLEAARIEQALDMARIEEQREIMRREHEIYAESDSPPPAEARFESPLKNRI